jgi:hypothetical protein
MQSPRLARTTGGTAGFRNIRARADAPRERAVWFAHLPQLSTIRAQKITIVDNSQKPKIRIAPPSMRVIPLSSP